MPALADSPRQLIPFQAKLTDRSGQTVPDQTYPSVIFSIYDAPTGGGALWSEPHQNVEVKGGQINVVLGSIAPLSEPDTTNSLIDFRTPKYLGISLDPLVEMVPRHRLVPSFYSFEAVCSQEAALATDAGLLGRQPGSYYETWQTASDFMTSSNFNLGSLEAEIKALEDDFANFVPDTDVALGKVGGRVEYVGWNKVRLAPYNWHTLVVEIDGEIVPHSEPEPLEFSLEDPNNLCCGESEEGDRFYYMYVQKNGDGLMPWLSKVAPVDGSHPSLAQSRYVGEFYNGPGGHIVPADHNPLTREYRLLEIPSSWGVIELDPYASPIYMADSSSLVGRLPKTATAVLLELSGMAHAASYYVASHSMVGEYSVVLGPGFGEPPIDGSEGLTGTFCGCGVDYSCTDAPTPGGQITLGSAMLTESYDRSSSSEVFWLPVDGSDPRFARAAVNRGCESLYGLNWPGATLLDPVHMALNFAAFTRATLSVMGWRSARSPSAAPPGGCPVIPGARAPVHRSFWEGKNHLYSRNRRESLVRPGPPPQSPYYPTFIESTEAVFRYFWVYQSPAPGLVPFYRCHKANGYSFLTTSSVCEGSPGTSLDYMLGYVATSDAVCGAIPLYRLLKPSSNWDHFYTTDPAERDAFMANGYTWEGNPYPYVYVWPEG